MTCTKIFIAALFVVAITWKMREYPSIGEWLNTLGHLLVMEYYCAQRNHELEEFHVNWNDLQELMQSEREQNQENIVHRDRYTVAQSNVMDFSISSNAMIQDNSVMRKNASHIQRKNCGNRYTELKQLLDHIFQRGYDWECKL